MRMQKETSEKPEERFNKLCTGWFHNRMTVILLALQDIRRLGPDTIMRIRFFLHDMEHHYLLCSQDQKTQAEILGLKTFFEKYPEVNAAEVQEAFQSVKNLYTSLGLHLSVKVIIPRMGRRCENSHLTNVPGVRPDPVNASACQTERDWKTFPKQPDQTEQAQGMIQSTRKAAV